MAKVEFSSSGVVGHRGAMGKAVYRMRGEETFLARRPRRSNREPSEAQLEARKRFRAAIEYGKDVMADPDLRALYEEEARESGKPIFSLTIRDYFNPPEIFDVDLEAYTGTKGDVIEIVATDDVKVVGVTVKVTEADGTLIEEGAAMVGARAGKWVYKATQSVPAETTVRIAVTATDLPGGTRTEELEAVV